MTSQDKWSAIDRSGLRTAAIFGRFVLKPVYRRLMRTGQFRVVGLEHLIAEVRKGRLIIVLNHPTLIDSFLPSLALTPYWYDSSRFFTWSMPDLNYFEKFLKLPFPWIPRVLRCVTVDRSAVGHAAAALHQAAIDSVSDILEHDYCVVWHFEAGRTCTGKSWEESAQEGVLRRVRKNGTSQIARVAARVRGCRVLPAYLDVPWADHPLGFWTCVWRLISKRYPPVTLYIRNPTLTFEEPLNAIGAQKIIKESVLTS